MASVVASGITAGIGSDNAALLAMFAVTPTSILSNTATTAQLTWNFNSGSEAFDYLATGQVLTLTYVVQAVDSNGTPASGTRIIIITITGTNDVPTVTLSAGDSDASPLTETDAGLSTTGTLTVTDLDYTNTVTASVASVVASGVTAGIIPNNAALLAMLAVTPTSILSNTATTATLTWNFNSGSEAFNYLAAGEQLVLTYVVRATDSNGTPTNGTRNVVITIAGTNDAPTITIGSGNIAAATIPETNATLTTSGTLSIVDLDYSNIVTSSVVTMVKSGTINNLGSSDSALQFMLTLSPSPVIGSTATTGTLTWSFASGSEKFDYLAAGESLVLTYTIRVTDSNSPATTADRVIIITINGTNDVPTITLAGGDSAASSLTETNADLASSGTLTVTDLDYTNTVIASVASVVASGVESVTVILPLATSTSANGVPVNTRLPLTSSVTVNDEGAETVGASFTAVIELLRTTVLKL